MAEWSSAQVNNFPDSSFAHIEPGGQKDSEGKTTPRSLRHLPFRDEGGKVDPAHVRNALARLNQTHIPDAAKQSARGKLTSAAKGVGVQVAEKSGEQELLDIDQVELSLTKTPAVQEGFVVTKSAVQKKDKAKLREEFEKLDEEALFTLYEKAQEPPEDEEEEEEEDPKKKKGKVPPQFNFDKASDDTKTALRTIGEALVNVTDLPEPVAEFAKSIREKLPTKDNGNKTDAEKLAFFKSTFPGVIETATAPIQKQLEETQESVSTLQSEKELGVMRELAAELPGEVEVVAKRLLSIQKSMTPEDFQAYIEEQKALKAQVEKSEVFKRQSSAQAAPASAEAAINQKATELIAKSDNGVSSLGDAYEVITKTDPDLWRQYQDEVRTRSPRRL